MTRLLQLGLVSCLAAGVFATSGCGDDGASQGGGGETATGGAGGSGGNGGSGGATGLVCEAPLISKGPWVVGIDGTSAKIRWEACAPGSISGVVIEPEAGGPALSVDSVESEFELTTTYTAPLSSIAPPDWAGTYYMHEARPAALLPGTCYRFHLAADEQRSGRFCTARPTGSAFTFMAIGDTNPALGSTDDTLSHALPQNPDFTLHGGDIQYYDSLLETWAFWFPIMQPMLSQGGFFPAIGNHEAETSEELSEYALRFFGEPGFDGGETYYRFESGGIWFFSVNTEEPISQGSAQALWLQASLEDASAQPGYRGGVVFFHRPLVTCGDTGDDPAALAFLGPIFETTGVLFVLQAHMHGYERFEFGSGPTYLTCAGGGGLLGDVDENIDRPYCVDRLASGAFYHAAIFDVGATEIEVRVIDRDGVVQDSFQKALP